MSIRRVLRVLFVLAFFFGPLSVSGILNARRILESAEAYERSSFLVTDFYCIGGVVTQPDRGPSTTSPVYCFIRGTVNGVEEELRVGERDEHLYPSGSSLDVWYAPELSAFGAGYQPLRVLPDDGDEPASGSTVVLAAWYRLLVLFPISVLFLELFYSFTVRPFWRMRDPKVLTVGEDGLAVSLGYGFAAFGITLIVFEHGSTRRPGAFLAGGVLVALGLVLCIRRVHRVDAVNGVVTTRRGFWPLVLPAHSEALPDAPEVAVKQEHARGAAEVFVQTESRNLRVQSTTDASRALGIARDLAEILAVPLRQEWPSDGSGGVLGPTQQMQAAQKVRRRRSRGWMVRLGFLAAVVAGVAAFLASPQFSTPLMERALSPATGPVPISVQNFAARALGRVNASDTAVLHLLRAVNTADPDYDQALEAAAFASLETIAGTSFEGRDRIDRLRALNVWAASRLDREVDANGGVLTWFEPDVRVLSSIESVASANPNDAWIWWSSFGAGTFHSDHDFAAGTGRGLADARPLSFAIKRGSFRHGPGEGRPPYEGQPEPIAEHADEVLVRTVGGALALKMWEYTDTGAESFPEDFAAWWHAHAASLLLPPLPDAERRPAGTGPVSVPSS